MTRVVAIVVVVALVLGGAAVTVVAAVSALDLGGSDGSTDGAPPTTSPRPGATRAPEPALARFYDQTLDWQECGSAQCSYLTLPVDYDDPGGETFDLAVLKVPAAEPRERIGSMVVNPGGPGASGTSYAAQASLVFGQPLLDHYDVVGFDPRGTGFSSPVDCLSDAELDAFLAEDPAPDDPGEAATIVRNQREFFAGCDRRTGPLLGHVTTVEAARDMDVLRAALGESELTYLGASYGTKLGATYADLFPERVGRFVLDGAVDVSLSSDQLGIAQAEGFQRALTAYVGDCVDGGDCFLGDSVDAGLQRIADFLDQVDAEPIPAGDRDLTVGLATYGLIAPLYNRDYWPMLSQALRTAFDGDATALLRLADLYASRNPDGSYADNSSEAIYVINCLDDPYALPAARVPSRFAAYDEASPTLGRVFAWGLVGCTGITVKAAEPAPDIDAAGAAPIVVIGTTRDPATPYEWAQALSAQLDSGVLVTRDGDGHTGYNVGNDCVDDAVEDYLVDGTVPDDGLEC